MHLYLAGNFVIMGDKEKERKFQSDLGEGNRLGSFFYKKEIDIITDLKEEEQNEKKKNNKEGNTDSKRIRKRTVRKVKIVRKKKNP